MFDTDTNVDTGTTNAATDTTAAEAFANAFGVYPADNSTPAEPADEQKADQPEAKAKDKDDGTDYPIRYRGKDEILHLTPDQHTAMLQKGYDYDNVKKQLEELTAKSKDVDVLNSMAEYYARNNGISRKELLDMIAAQTSEDGIRAQIEADYPDISEDARAELIEARVAKLHAAKEAALEEEAAKDMAALYAEYPHAPKDINEFPSDVQADINNGMKPLEAYRLHELKELRKAKAALDTEIDALKKEKDNRSHSLGRIDDNAGERGVDAFTAGFKGYMGG